MINVNSMRSNLSLTQLCGGSKSKLHLVADFVPIFLRFYGFNCVALLLHLLLCFHPDLFYRVVDFLDVFIAEAKTKHHRGAVS